MRHGGVARVEVLDALQDLPKRLQHALGAPRSPQQGGRVDLLAKAGGAQREHQEKLAATAAIALASRDERHEPQVLVLAVRVHLRVHVQHLLLVHGDDLLHGHFVAVNLSSVHIREAALRQHVSEHQAPPIVQLHRVRRGEEQTQLRADGRLGTPSVHFLHVVTVGFCGGPFKRQKRAKDGRTAGQRRKRSFLTQL
eukprot:scaffold7358_cov252-Pinguiococcus_pyrenoidosus.AAC.25